MMEQSWRQIEKRGRVIDKRNREGEGIETE